MQTSPGSHHPREPGHRSSKRHPREPGHSAARAYACARPRRPRRPHDKVRSLGPGLPRFRCAVLAALGHRLLQEPPLLAQAALLGLVLGSPHNPMEVPGEFREVGVLRALDHVRVGTLAVGEELATLVHRRRHLHSGVASLQLSTSWNCFDTKTCSGSWARAPDTWRQCVALAPSPKTNL